MYTVILLSKILRWWLHPRWSCFSSNPKEDSPLSILSNRRGNARAFGDDLQLPYTTQCPLTWSSKNKLFKPAEPIFIDNLQF